MHLGRVVADQECISAGPGDHLTHGEADDAPRLMHGCIEMQTLIAKKSHRCALGDAAAAERCGSLHCFDAPGNWRERI